VHLRIERNGTVVCGPPSLYINEAPHARQGHPMSMDETWCALSLFPSFHPVSQRIPVQVQSYLPQVPGVSILLSDVVCARALWCRLIVADISALPARLIFVSTASLALTVPLCRLRRSDALASLRALVDTYCAGRVWCRAAPLRRAYAAVLAVCPGAGDGGILVEYARSCYHGPYLSPFGARNGDDNTSPCFTRVGSASGVTFLPIGIPGRRASRYPHLIKSSSPPFFSIVPHARPIAALRPSFVLGPRLSSGLMYLVWCIAPAKGDRQW
jgi:hypothetical protein